MRQLLRSKRGKTAIWLVVLNYLQAGLGFLIQLWLANLLGAAGYGVLSYCVIIGAFVAVLTAFASDRTLVRDLVQGGDAHEILTASMVLRGGVSLLALIACAIWLLAAPLPAAKAWAIAIGTVSGVLMGLFPTAWFDCRYEMNLHAGITLAEKVLFGVLVGLLLMLPLGVNGSILAVLCLLAARLVSFAVQWGVVLRSFRPRLGRLKANLLWLVQQNGLILGALLANLCITHANQIVLDRQDGAARLGYYSVAFQIASVIIILQGQIVRLLGPRVAEITQTGSPVDAMRRGLLRFCFYSLLVTVAVVLPLGLFAPWILAICLKPEYQASVTPLRILCVWAVLNGPGIVVNQFLLCLRLNTSYFVLAVIAGGSALVLGQFLVPGYGTSGVAMALLCSHFVSIAAQCALVWWKMASLQGEYGRSSGDAIPAFPIDTIPPGSVS